jgi:RimJ/RimL family protein N-acetyltransferase
MMPEHYDALRRGKDALGAALGVRVPPEWPTFPESIMAFEEVVKGDAEWHGWGTWLVVHAADRVLIGEGGYGGPPDEARQVEIGYAIVPAYRGAGYAGEFASALARRAFADPRVAAVRAGTEKVGADAEASMAIARRLGMRRIADAPEGFVWLVERAEFERAAPGA